MNDDQFRSKTVEALDGLSKAIYNLIYRGDAAAMNSLAQARMVISSLKASLKRQPQQ